ncbi:GNAT family protein [Halocynthiibacter sp. C4]|uniref:GNAT family N-acetyltransferase n=1 Tax=Halocynthiibacter sp. C4 TaxID=2992758 RepID=UPI00237AC1E4|nr:GNAT family protein [Halocynthiibacter sp. C4]MDE0590252.1 GNAT family protein [Halocynthiibacter sp. C4]
MTGSKIFGEPLPDWTPPPMPQTAILKGRYAQLEPLNADAHASGLYQANAASDEIWNYLPYGPFSSLPAYHRWMRGVEGQNDPFFYAIRDLETGALGGVASFLRITPQSGSIEVGHINFSPTLQRTRAATEAMFLMMQWAFEAGYRRYEWKCDALNLASRRAAQRLGLSYEGVFRQATVYKGRNRDTAWFAAIDKEWPALKSAFSTWLSLDNFDTRGRQIERLADLTALVRVADDPEL